MLNGQINNLTNVKSIIGQLSNQAPRNSKASETNSTNSLDACQTCTHSSQTTSQMSQSLISSHNNQLTSPTDLSTPVNYPNPNAYNAALHLLELTGKNVNLRIAPNCLPVDTSSLPINTSSSNGIEGNSGNLQQYSTSTDANLMTTLPITSNHYHQQQMAISGSLESNAINDNSNSILSSVPFNNQLNSDIMATHIQITQDIDMQIKNLLCLSKLFDNGTFANTLSVYKGMYFDKL